nr:lamin tail domain-containing protein [Deinococcus radiopugnans]
MSQIYGGGGNSGATLKNDFVELFNAGKAAVSTAGKSVQYASKTGAFTNVFALPTATIEPGAYYLIALAKGAGGTADLPTPDATGTLGLSGSDGKVTLVGNIEGATGLTDTDVLDFVGYGAANEAEGGASTPALSSTTAALRAGNGCTDTNNNGADFTAAAPAPRNSASPKNVCP